MSDGDYRRDLGLFFKSVHGTLNHLLLVERMWRGRLRGQISAALTQLGQRAPEMDYPDFLNSLPRDALDGPAVATARA